MLTCGPVCQLLRLGLGAQGLVLASGPSYG